MRRAKAKVVVPAIAGVLLVLLASAEFSVRTYAAHRVSAAARTQLGATSSSIGLGDTPVLFDLARNRVAQVSVTASNADLCSLPGASLAATFRDLSLLGGRHVKEADVQLTLTAAGLTKFAQSRTPLSGALTVSADPGDQAIDLNLGGGALRVRTRPKLQGTMLSLVPVSVSLFGMSAPAAVLDRFIGSSGLERNLTHLPLNLTPASASVTSAGLALRFRGGPADLDAAVRPVC